MNFMTLFVLVIALEWVPLKMLDIFARTVGKNASGRVFDIVGFALLFTMLSNIPTIAYCVLPVILIAIILLDRLIWRSLARAIYPLCEYGLAKNKKALVAIGSVAILAAFDPHALNIDKLLKYLG
jgi:hypothetical protein